MCFLLIGHFTEYNLMQNQRADPAAGLPHAAAARAATPSPQLLFLVAPQARQEKTSGGTRPATALVRPALPIEPPLSPTVKCWCLFILDFFSVPLLHAIVGAVVGLIPPFHRSFFNSSGGGGIFTTWLTSALKSIGGLFEARERNENPFKMALGTTAFRKRGISSALYNHSSKKREHGGRDKPPS
ncbi:hypothetical protein L209DRAFT_778034 [Thermothelomyces heterothallicus CBS 203.75]